MRPPDPTPTIGMAVPERNSTHGLTCIVPKGWMGKTMPTLDRAFALRLHGMGTREGPDGRLLALTATVDRGFGGFGEFSEQNLEGAGGAAWLVPDRLSGLAAELELALTGPDTFQGTAAIGIGTTRAIRLTTMGTGYLEPAPDRSLSGVAAWRADTGVAGCPAIVGMVASLITIGAATAGRFEHEIWLLVPGSLAGLLNRDV